MATTIKLKNGSGAPTTGDLVQGEPAFDLTNKRLYTEDSGGSVIEVGTNPSTLTVDTTTLVVDAGNNRVGIGTASPAVKTQIVGSGAIFRISDDVSTSGTIELSASSSEAVIHANTYASAVPLVFKNASTERMRIDSSGNVGIGTTSTTFRFNVSSSSSTSTNLTSTSGTSNLRLTNSGGLATLGSTGNELHFTTSLTERMRIDSSGNVGIGTASPSHSLDVSTGATSRINTTDGTRTFLSGVWASQPRIETSGGTLSVAASGAYDIAFSTNGSERMRVLSSGGLTFNGDTAAANALDDYEEGTWTPTFFDDEAGGTNLTYSQQTGTYTKIGRLVYLKFRITVSAKGGTGSGQGLFIASLPFNIGYFSSTVSTAMFDANQADNITNVSAPEELSAYSFSANPTVLYLLSSGGSVNSNSVQSNTVLEGSIIYHA